MKAFIYYHELVRLTEEGDGVSIECAYPGIAKAVLNKKGYFCKADKSGVFVFGETIESMKARSNLLPGLDYIDLGVKAKVKKK